MRWVRADDPQPLDAPLANAIDDLVVSQGVGGGNPFDGKAEDLRNLRAVIDVEKISSAEQSCRIGKEPRAHRVALAGNAVGAGARPPDVAGHQGEVDDGLGR